MAQKTQEQIKQEMAANSAAWHTADAATKKQLEQANKDLGAQLGANFNEKSGTWSNSSGQQLYEVKNNSSPGPSSSPNKQPTSTAPQNFQGSATGVQTSTPEQDLIKAQMNQNSVAWHSAPSGDVNTPGTKEWLHAQNQALAAQLGLDYGKSFDPVTGTWSGSAAKVEQPVVQLPTAQTPATQAPTLPDLSGLLKEWQDAATAQNDARIDYNVQKAVLELQRALADAQPQFKEQTEQVARDEMQARDNSALYSELRGDKGGIGKEQYSSIMNAAAQNRLTVQQAQTKMATDVERQIADLRAQGEFEKADATVEILQTYLTQLIALEQWAANYNLSAAEFNESVRQWEAQFQQAVKEFDTELELSKAQLTGAFSDGTTTLDAQNLVTKQLADSGTNLLAYGIMPSDEQLKAMGYTKEQATALVQAVKLEKAAKEAAGKDNGDGDSLPNLSADDVYAELYSLGYTNKDEAAIKAYLLSAGLTSTKASAYAEAYASSIYKQLKNAQPAPEEEPVIKMSAEAENVKKKLLSIPGLTEENKVEIIVEAAKAGLSEEDELALYAYFNL